MSSRGLCLKGSSDNEFKETECEIFCLNKNSLRNFEQIVNHAHQLG